MYDPCQMTQCLYVGNRKREVSGPGALPEGMTEFRPNESIFPAFPITPCSRLNSDVQRVVNFICQVVALFTCCGLLKAAIFGLSLDFELRNK